MVMIIIKITQSNFCPYRVAYLRIFWNEIVANTTNNTYIRKHINSSDFFSFFCICITDVYDWLNGMNWGGIPCTRIIVIHYNSNLTCLYAEQLCWCRFKIMNCMSRNCMCGHLRDLLRICGPTLKGIRYFLLGARKL